MDRKNFYQGPVIFDADGVLFDSLPPHALFCWDMNKEFNYGLNLPIPLDRKSWVKIAGSPMRKFLENAGFKTDLDNLVKLYEERFSLEDRYKVEIFEEVPELLRDLSKRGRPLGVASANVRANILKGLGDLSSYFSDVYDKNCFGGDKAAALVRFAYEHDCGIFPERVTFIGDMPSDKKAAERAGVSFIWAKYGWCDSLLYCESAENVGDLRKILGLK